MNPHNELPILRLTDPRQAGEAVLALQQQLAQLNIAVTPDGIFGPGTDKAVKTFQTQHDLTPDGIAGPATQAKLQQLLGPSHPPQPPAPSQPVPSAPPASDSPQPEPDEPDASPITLKPGTVSLEVLEIQKKLQQQNLLNGNLDGDFGSKTKAAIMQFQEQANLIVDGIAGPKVLEALGLQFNRFKREAATQFFTVKVVSDIFIGAPVSNITKYLPKVLEALEERDLDDRDMILMALATIRAESARFEPNDEGIHKYNTDLPDGEPFALYDLRTDIGNNAVGDGAKYKGRGFIQLTGKINYQEYGERIGVGDRLLNNPELANDPKIAADVLAQFLKQKEGQIRVALHQGDFARARQSVNGGQHGLESFTAAMNTGRSLIG